MSIFYILDLIFLKALIAAKSESELPNLDGINEYVLLSPRQLRLYPPITFSFK